MDLYRIHDGADVLALGLEYMYGDGVRSSVGRAAEDLMPPDCLWVSLRYVDEHPAISPSRPTGPLAHVLANLRRELASTDGEA